MEVIYNQMMIDKLDVLVMSAGTGARMGATERKQWLSLCGRPLFVFTVEQLLSFGVTSCILVVHQDDYERVQKEVTTRRLEHVKVVIGGEDRQLSVWRGLQLAQREFVVVHDGARPFLTENDFLAVIKTALSTGAATLAHPVTDTLKRVDVSREVAEHVDRAGLWTIQTPQVFLRTWLYKAHVAAQTEDYHGTDDTVLIERMGESVSLVYGSKWNVKLTDPEDVAYMRLWEAVSCGLD